MSGSAAARRRHLRASQAVFEHRLVQAGTSGRTLREKLRTLPKPTLLAAGVGLGLVAARLPARAALAIAGGLLTVVLRVLSAPLLGPVAVGAIMARRNKRAGHEHGTTVGPR
jgi:hypothetical protein